MNPWLQYSIEYANQKSYLDDLFHVYPTIPDGIRDIDELLWADIEKSFESRDNIRLIKDLIRLDLFPIKDSYVAYLKRDNNSIERNPRTVNRICGRIYEMGLEKVFEKCSEPKETNRQIGPMFRNWLGKGVLGITPVGIKEFMSNEDDAILDAGDSALMAYSKDYLNYMHPKGLDFVGRFNGKYVIAEAKFLSDFGGHQNAQFNDAINTIHAVDVNAIKVAILDGVLYIKGRNKMYKAITGIYKEENIMSALVFRDFLYQI